MPASSMSMIVLESVIFFFAMRQKNKSFSGLEGQEDFDFLDFFNFLDFFLAEGLFEAFKQIFKLFANGDTLLDFALPFA